MDYELNDLDRKILRLLRADAKIVLKDIADELDSTPSTIHNRLKKLEDIGVILKHTIDLNLDYFGFNLSSFVMLKYDKRETKLDSEELAKQIANIKRVQEVHLISGDFDMILKVRAKDVEDLGNFVNKELNTLKGVASSTTYVSFKSIKVTNQGPFVVDIVE